MGGVASSVRILRKMTFRGGLKIKLDPLPEKGGDWVNSLGQVAQERAIVPHTAHQGANLL